METVPVDCSNISFEVLTVIAKPARLTPLERSLMQSNGMTLPQHLDRDGCPVWTVEVLAVGAERTDVTRVSIATAVDLPADLPRGTGVTFANLRARLWSMEGRSGLAFSADSIQRAGHRPPQAPKPPTNGSKPAEPSSNGNKPEHAGAQS